MDLVDVIIIILFIGMIIRGSEIGFTRQIFATVGFMAGIFLGALLTPHILHHASNSQAKALWTIFITLGCGIIGLSLGEFVGLALKQKIMKKSKVSKLVGINKVDAVMGSLLGVVTLLAVIWLGASVLIKLPYMSLQSEIQQSTVVGDLDGVLPPAPNVIARLGHLIAPNGFPQVFIGNEPAPSSPVDLPSAGAFQGVVNADAGSVVQVEGLGCGGIVEGSGFVASSDLVITNAHVVAGVAAPYVIDQNGKHAATAIWFDPNLDLSVLRVNDLAGKALTMVSTTQTRGTQGEIMGYPGGGPLSASPAAILEEFNATGRNIYNEGSTDRDIYELQANIIPGNSGGPMINAQGNVIGIVFATSTVYNHVGYALTMKAVIAEFNKAETQNQTTGTGTCAE